MTMLRSSNPDLYDKNISKIFYQKLAGKPQIYSRCINVLTTGEKQEVMSGVSGLGLLSKKNEGAEYNADELLQLYDKTFTPDTYAGTVRASDEAVEDDRTGRLETIPSIFADSMYATQEYSFAQLLDRSQTDTGPDATYLGSTSHPLNPNSATTWANRPTSNVDLSQTVLEDAISSMMARPNARNIVDPIMPKYLIVAPANMINAKKILSSAKVTGSADNDPNVIQDFNIELIVNPFITDTGSWHLLAAKDKNQFVFLVRRKPRSRVDTDTLTDDVLYKANARWTVGYVDARGYHGSLGA